MKTVFPTTYSPTHPLYYPPPPLQLHLGAALTVWAPGGFGLRASGLTPGQAALGVLAALLIAGGALSRRRGW